MTDTSRLPLLAWLTVSDRGELVEQRVTVSATWWQEHRDARRLPGGPLRVQCDEHGEFLTRAARLLRQAAAMAPDDPQAAYAVLHPKGQGVLRQLGPAFGTKFLYFAGRGAAGHRSAILDQRTATALKKAGWSSLHPEGGWPAMTYGRYCALARRWAYELSQPDASVRADQVEYALFHSPHSRRAIAS